MSDSEAQKFKAKINYNATFVNNEPLQRQKNIRNLRVNNQCFKSSILVSFHSERYPNMFNYDENLNILSLINKANEITTFLEEDKLILNEIFHNILILYDVKTVQKFFIKSDDYFEYRSTTRTRPQVMIVSKISVKRRIVRLEFSLQLKIPSNIEIIKNLKAFMASLNKNDFRGKFYLEKNISYVSTFYAMEISKYNGSIFLILQEILNKEITPNVDNFISIVNNMREKVCIKPNVQNDKKIDLIVSETQLRETKEIFKRLDEDKATTFFISRFLTKSVRFGNNQLTIFVKNPTERLEDVFRSKNELYNALSEIALELSKYYLGFKPCYFLNYMKVFQEKPVFTYEVPLSEIIEIYPRITHEYLDSIVGKHITQIEIENKRKKHKKKNDKEFKDFINKKAIKRESLNIIHENLINLSQEKNFTELSKVFDENMHNYQNTTSIKLSTQTANARFQFNKVLCFPFVIKIEGFINKGQNCIVIYRNFDETLEERIKNIDSHKFKLVVMEILAMVEIIQLKDSQFGSFDLSCFGYCENKLKMLLKSSDEIEDDYLAPEVKLGRSSNSSIIFSLGTLVQKVVEMNQNLHSSFQVENFVNICKKISIFERGAPKYLVEALI
jgi:hypothetical protein